MVRNKNKLAEKSLFANFKNFILNFGIAIIWLVKSISKICRHNISDMRKKYKKKD